MQDTKDFHVIAYNVGLGQWHRLHPHGFTLEDAKQFRVNYTDADQRNLDVIHTMWLDCLEEWFKPKHLEG